MNNYIGYRLIDIRMDIRLVKILSRKEVMQKMLLRSSEKREGRGRRGKVLVALWRAGLAGTELLFIPGNVKPTYEKLLETFHFFDCLLYGAVTNDWSALYGVLSLTTQEKSRRALLRFSKDQGRNTGHDVPIARIVNLHTPVFLFLETSSANVWEETFNFPQRYKNCY